MHVLLLVKSKYGVINGFLPTLDLEDDLIQYQTWLCGDNIVISWLSNLILKDIHPTTVYYHFAAEILSNLKD